MVFSTIPLTYCESISSIKLVLVFNYLLNFGYIVLSITEPCFKIDLVFLTFHTFKVLFESPVL